MITSLLLAAPVVDIDGTIFVQGAIFIGLMIVLKPMLFDPWLRAQERRVEAIDGATAKAKGLRVEAEGLAHDHDARLEEARERAHDLRAATRREEEARQAKSLADTRTAAATRLEADKARLQQEAEQARTALRGRIEQLAADVASKLLGRPVQ